MKEYSENTVREIIMTLISMGYIFVTADKFPVLKLSPKSAEVLKGNEKVYHKKHLLDIKPSPKKDSKTDANLEGLDEELFLKLKEMRYSISQDKKMAPFMIFHDSTLKEMATYFPQNKAAILTIKGVGLKKFETYGEAFLEVIKEHCTKNNVNPIEKIVEYALENHSTIDRYQQTYELYQKNMTLKEIAENRNFTVNTIIEHLSKCEKTGQTVDWSRFIDNPAKEEIILNAIKNVGFDKLKPIKEIVPDEITYEDIKIIIAKNGLN